MAELEIRDTSFWTKHISGDDALRRSLESLAAGDLVTLWIDGACAEFEKMRDGVNGPTPGFKPRGSTRDLWRSLYPSKRGTRVSIALKRPPPIVGASMPAPSPLPETRSEATDAERDAAWRAFKALSTAGWKSSGEKLTRDDLHER